MKASEYRRPRCDNKRAAMNAPRRGSRAAGVVLVLAAAVLWSTGGLGIKSTPLPPLALAGYRGLFALPVLLGMVAVRGRQVGQVPWRRVAASPWAWMGSASYGVMVIAFVVATKLTTAANAIFIQYTSPAYVALLSWPLLRERVTWRDGVACAGVLAGMVLFFAGDLSATARAGNLVAVVSSFGAAGLPLALRADQRRHVTDASVALVAPALAIAAGDALAVLACAPAMIASPPPDARTWMLVVALGLFQIGVPYVLYAMAIPRLTALEGSLLPTLEPILNPVWVALVTGETPGHAAILGGACVLGSIVFQACVPRRRE
jgi:drug/metabolite transporter, DME family